MQLVFKSTENVYRDNNRYNNIILLDWKNCIHKFPKQGKYHFSDYVRIFHDLPFKDTTIITKKEMKLIDEYL